MQRIEILIPKNRQMSFVEKHFSDKQSSVFICHNLDLEEHPYDNGKNISYYQMELTYHVRPIFEEK